MKRPKYMGEVAANTPQELLQAQAHVWNHMFQFINSMSLKCAVELSIPDAIHNHGQPISLPQLISALNLHPSKSHFISRLMRILVHSDFFGQHDDEDVLMYSLTPASRLLLKGGTSALLLMDLDPVMMAPFHIMGTWFQTADKADAGDIDPPAAKSAFEMEHGRNFWEFGAQEPRFGKMFNEAMEADSHLLASALLAGEECKGVFEGVNSLVDVGGGTGTMGKAIANAFPNIHCTVFDAPHVVSDLEGTRNLDFVGGDMFEEIPPANAILLKWIMHNWNDEESIKILKKCRDAILKKSEEGVGKLIILDIAVSADGGHDQKDKIHHGNNKKSIETQLMMDMLMMVMFIGKERSEAEWEKLFLAAGFSHHKITHSLGLRSIIEVYP